ncbi:MAG TPA: DNA polymerase III subunit gamma/tau [Xanthobacteraceae bacterium]|nr:DNA polymerase III subunit gamma/tau [Xanthobacteraceae bacterium]
MAESPDRREDPQEGARRAAPAYRVLARKYRPATFEDLIGQEAMVRTLSNAFETGRVPQAWILTGVRGVGKTTTARILARALNYQRADGSGGPTIAMPELGVHCQAIMESRHVDVLEMDAASHNGVDDVRQINEAVRYAPVTARYKVYILDEVHMLSGAAFNALLKTLEEPPPHAKFVFATTEVRKVPVTVLSRCQRFDLRRVEAAVLLRHLGTIAAKEGVAIEADALALIARAADGSVRDALSLLDQAMAHAGPVGASTVRATDVRQMLGLADRARVIDLFEAVMRGNVATALKELRDQYDCGADPVVVLADLADFTHVVTRLKIVPEGPGDLAIGEAEQTRGRALAAALPMRVLSRAWQMLLRGIAEVQTAGKPIAAAEMVLVRIAYAADLPTPEDVIRSLGRTERRGIEAAPAAQAASEAATPLAAAPRLETARVEAPRAAAASLARAVTAPSPQTSRAPGAPSVPPITRFEDLIALVAARRDLVIKTALERDVRLVRIEDGTLEIALESGASKTLVNDLSCKLGEWTGRRWMVIVSAEPGAPTLRSQIEADRRELLRGVQADPLVQAVLSRFPGAEILDVRRRAPEPVIEGGLNPDMADGDDDDDGAGLTDAGAL